MPLRGVLFDLDDTLFDHNHATDQALARLSAEEAAFAQWEMSDLRVRHSLVLEALHAEVIAGSRTIASAREERFRRLLEDAAEQAPPPGRAMALAEVYRVAYKASWRPVPGATALLTALQSTGLSIGIVTNNLTAEQTEKLLRCELGPLVDAMVTSEDAGMAKPDKAIFVAALERLQIAADDAVMVGDAWVTDVLGAIAAGIRPVWFNWRQTPTPDASVTEIDSLEPLERALGSIHGALDKRRT